jgi:hypothetical protein
VQWDARNLALPAGATFTRAGTAFVVNYEGVLILLSNNEIPWVGVRRVSNRATALTTHSVTIANGEKFQVTIKGNAGATCVLSGAISMTLTADGANRITSPDGTAWTAGSTTLTMTVTGTLTELQLENCEQRVGKGGIPSEWVNFAVAHNAGVNGVKVFDYLNGNTVDAAGVVTEARGGDIDTSKIHLLVQTTKTNIMFPANCEITPSGKWTSIAPGTVSTLSAGIAPTGFTGATRITEVAGNGGHAFYKGALFGTAPSNTKYCYSLYAKAGTRNTFILECGNTAYSSVTARAVFDLTTGELLASEADLSSYGSEYIGNGWWRFWISRVTTALGTIVMAVNLPHPVTFASSWDSDGTGTVLVWGAQTEVGIDTPTSFINTTTAAITRAVDVLNFSGATGYPPFDITNRARNSNLMADTNWGTNPSPNGLTFTNNALMAPPKTVGYGTRTAALATPDATNGTHGAWQYVTDNAAIAPLTTYCRSLYVNRNGSAYQWITVRLAGSSYASLPNDCQWDLDTGEGEVIAGTYISDFGSEYVGEGWWRLWVVGTTDADGGSPTLSVLPTISASSYTFTGDGTGLGLYGGQLELGAGPPGQLAVTSTMNVSASDNEVLLSYLGGVTKRVYDFDGVVDGDPQQLFGKLRAVRVYKGDLS